MKYLKVTSGSGSSYIDKKRNEKGQFVPSGGRNKERTKEYLKQYYENIRLKLLQTYSMSEIPFCKCCNESFYGFLTIDHIVPNGGIDRKNRPGIGWMLDILRNEPNYEAYQVLCYNCNLYKRADVGKICPHQQN